MEKLLTISVAAYNVEKYLRYCLDSLIVDEKLLERLEVFVVDDGGSDSSLNIAYEYEHNYPGVFKAIHKNNGGYGSVVNWTISHASGKYFKLLDGDDWYDTAEFEGYLKYLEQEDSDIVLSDYNVVGKNDVRKKKTVPLIRNNDFNDLYNKCVIKMWSLTYRTELLQKNKIVLPEKKLYTDVLLGAYALCYASSGHTCRKTVYCYRVGREGQSTEFKSRISHADDTKYICNCLLKICCEAKKENYENIQAIYTRTADACISYLDILLQKSDEYHFKEYDYCIKNTCYEVYSRMPRVGKKGIFIICTRFMNYKLLPIIKTFRRAMIKRGI